MTADKTLLFLPGDGIGPEIMREVRRIMGWLTRYRGIEFEVKEALVGGCSIDRDGVPITDETMAMAMEADAVLLGGRRRPEMG